MSTTSTTTTTTSVAPTTSTTALEIPAVIGPLDLDAERLLPHGPQRQRQVAEAARAGRVEKVDHRERFARLVLDAAVPVPIRPAGGGGIGRRKTCGINPSGGTIA